jgi:hypothetical protein
MDVRSHDILWQGTTRLQGPETFKSMPVVQHSKIQVLVPDERDIAVISAKPTTADDGRLIIGAIAGTRTPKHFANIGVSIKFYQLQEVLGRLILAVLKITVPVYGRDYFPGARIGPVILNLLNLLIA